MLLIGLGNSNIMIRTDSLDNGVNVVEVLSFFSLNDEVVRDSVVVQIGDYFDLFASVFIINWG